MSVKSLAQAATRQVVKNSPAILTGLGVAGTFTTAVLTGRAAVQAHEALRTDPRDELTGKEKFELTWRYFVPPVLSGVVTASCILGSQSINQRRNAVLVSAYSISETALTEYRDKAVAVLGKDADEKVRTAIIDDRLADNPPPASLIIASDKVLCYDVHSGRYWECDMETIRKAQNDVNALCIQHMYASLNDFWMRVGLETLPHGDSLGWTVDVPLDLMISPRLSESGGKPCIAVDFRKTPVADYYRLS